MLNNSQPESGVKKQFSDVTVLIPWNELPIYLQLYYQWSGLLSRTQQNKAGNTSIAESTFLKAFESFHNFCE